MNADGGGASELRGHSGQERRSHERETARSRCPGRSPTAIGGRAAP